MIGLRDVEDHGGSVSPGCYGMTLDIPPSDPQLRSLRSPSNDDDDDKDEYDNDDDKDEYDNDDDKDEYDNDDDDMSEMSDLKVIVS